MRKLRPSICLDLSPWVRGPNTAVGLCALKMTQSILKEAFQKKREIDFEVYSKDPLSAEFKKKISAELQGLSFEWAPLSRRWLSKIKGQIFVSFDHRLLPVFGAKKVIVVHDTWTLRDNAWQSREFTKAQRPKIFKALANADLIFTPSKVVLEELRTYPRKITSKMSVLPWGPVVEPKSVQSGFMNKTLLMVSTFEKRKNHWLAFKLAKQLPVGWNFVFVGADGFGAESIQRAFESLKASGALVCRYQKLDPQELNKLYQEAFAVFAPSYEEGFGLSVLEGMAFGRPVFASRAKAHVEVGANAVEFFDVHQPSLEIVLKKLKALAESQSLYDKHVAGGLDRAKNFDWSSSARQCLDDLLKLA